MPVAGAPRSLAWSSSRFAEGRLDWTSCRVALLMSSAPPHCHLTPHDQSTSQGRRQGPCGSQIGRSATRSQCGYPGSRGSAPSESKGCSGLGLPASDRGDGCGAEWRAGQCEEPAQQVRSLWGSRKAWGHLGDLSEGMVRRGKGVPETGRSVRPHDPGENRLPPKLRAQGDPRVTTVPCGRIILSCFGLLPRE